MKKTLLFLLFLSVIISASTQKVEKNDATTHDIIQFEIPDSLNKSNTKRFKVSDIYTKMEGFELDKAAGPIGRISKALIYKDILYVLDSKARNKIMAFDLLNQGKFLYNIGTEGKGPGEFLMVTDFTIDKNSESLLVVDVRKDKLSYFNLDGTYNAEKQLDFSPIKISCDSNYYYFVQVPNNIASKEVIITDKNLVTVKVHMPTSQYPTSRNINSEFKTFNDHTFLNYRYCDSIFEVVDGKIQPYLILSSSGKSLFAYLNSEEYKPETKGEVSFSNILRDSIIPEEDNVFIPYVYFEDNKIQMFSFFKDKHMKFMVDIKNDSLTPSLGYIVEDIIGAVFNPIGHDEKYGTFSALQTNQIASSFNSSFDVINGVTVSNKLIEDINTSNDDSNPFIVFYN